MHENEANFETGQHAGFGCSLDMPIAGIWLAFTHLAFRLPLAPILLRSAVEVSRSSDFRNRVLRLVLNKAYTLSIEQHVFADRTITTLVIPDELAKRLRHVAQQGNRPVEDVLASLNFRSVCSPI
jgi:hypothetical protein